MMRCSIVIPTVEREQAVCDVLADLAQQTYEDIEIVIVDQSVKVSHLLSQRSDCVYVHLPEPSTTRARNVGTDTASGEIIFFLDDDVRISDPQIVAGVMAFFETHPEYAGVACTITDMNVALNKENRGFHHKVMHVTKTGAILPFAFGPEQDVLAPRGGAVAYRKKALVAIGGADHRYVGNAMREETDVSIRIVRVQGPIRYIPSCSIVHLALPRGGSRMKDRTGWYKDFFANELLFQLTHIPHRYLICFFWRKVRAMIACAVWYGKMRPVAVLAPFVGFYQGYARYRKGFTPYHFS